MSTRLLPRDEWPRLVGTELETIYPHLPATAQIVVVEVDDHIVASWALFPMWHAEGVSIAPEYRGNPRVVRRLLHGMQDTARAMGATRVWTSAVDDQIAALAQRIGGVELPAARHFSVCVDAKTGGQ